MNILFISYTGVSLQSAERTFALACALADAGYHVDIIAPFVVLPEHANFRVFAGTKKQPACRHRLRMRCIRSVRRFSYDALHATGDAAFFAMRLSRWTKIPLIYDASCRFTRLAVNARSFIHKTFPVYVRKLESKVLEKAKIILSPCSSLSDDLRSVERNTTIIQVPDLPMQSLVTSTAIDKSTLLKSFNAEAGPIVVCSILSDQKPGFRKLLMAVRKVVDSVPESLFVFKGVEGEHVKKMAINLDIADRCIFLPDDDVETFLSALDVADAALFIPQNGSRYIHGHIYTLLQSQSPVVAVHDSAYDDLLNEENSIRVIESSDSIAEGVLRVIREPLFSQAIATEGQKLIAANYTYSSFKHKVRMTYHQAFRQE